MIDGNGTEALLPDRLLDHALNIGDGGGTRRNGPVRVPIGREIGQFAQAMERGVKGCHSG